MLLIVAVLEEEVLAGLITCARALAMEPLVEVHPPTLDQIDLFQPGILHHKQTDSVFWSIYSTYLYQFFADLQP